MKKFLLIYFFLLASAFPQGSRPPITNLNGLTDVTLTSPADGQALIYNGGSSQWINGAIPGGALSALSDTAIVTPLDNQLLKYSSGSSKWFNYGPLNFTDLTGNIAVTQMNNGAGATATTYWRGDNTWASPPTGAITFTNNLLVGDNAGNAVDASIPYGLSIAPGTITFSQIGNFPTMLNIINGDSLPSDTAVTAKLMLQTSGDFVLESLGPSFVATGIFSPNDGRLTTSTGGIDLAGSGSIKFSTDGGVTERVRFGSGIMAGAFTDKGAGTVNVSNGYYVNGNKIGGVASVTSAVDQTATGETVHVTYTVPANTAAIGTVYRIHASGNVDNGTTQITLTPRFRWGGQLGTLLLATPTFQTSGTSNTNRAYALDGTVTIRTIGASGTAVSEMRYVERSTSTTGAETTHVDNSGTSAITIDTTASKDLVLTWALSVTTGTPHIRTISGVIEIVKP